MKLKAEDLTQYLSLLRAQGIESLPTATAAEASLLASLWTPVGETEDGTAVAADPPKTVAAAVGNPATSESAPEAASEPLKRPPTLRDSLAREENVKAEAGGAPQVAAGEAQQLSHRGRDFWIRPEQDSYPTPLGSADRVEALRRLQEQVAACEKCAALVGQRTQTVFGVGNPEARLCFFGEAPGADEDRVGEPFVGKAGQLLDRIIVACQLRREDVYILNTVKCRPPMNRNPEMQEQENCWDFARQQLQIIQPEMIVCLGAVAAKRLLVTEASMGMLRQRFFNYRNSQVAVTYHPAYLLRNPGAKADVWQDMKAVMARLGQPLD